MNVLKAKLYPLGFGHQEGVKPGVTCVCVSGGLRDVQSSQKDGAGQPADLSPLNSSNKAMQTLI